MANRAQRDYWTSASGDKWADLADRIDAAHAEVTRELVRRSGAGPGQSVLDVGCGAGTSVRAFLAAGSRVTGLDLSPRLLAHARASLPPGAEAALIEADAQDHAFQPAEFDVIASQFGVMFFDDPVVAFANLRRAAKPGACICFATWAAAEENPWFHIPKAAAEAELGSVETDPNAPSPTAFKDIGRVERILSDAGWKRVRGEAVSLDVTPPGLVRDAADQATRLGLAARIIRAKGADEDVRGRIVDRISADLGPFASPAGVRVPGRFNFFVGMNG